MISRFEDMIGRVDFTPESITTLTNAFEEHPYSPGLAILLAKAYAGNDDIRFEGMVRHAALLTNDRKRLHACIYENLIESGEGSREEGKGSDQNALSESGADDAGKSHTGITGDEKDDPLMKQFIAEAINAGAILGEIAGKTEEKDEAASKPQQPEVSGDRPITPETHDEAKHSAPLPTPSRQTLSAWLITLGHDEPSKAKDHPTMGEPGEPSSIIDHFIEKEDSIVPKRAEFFSPSKAAKASLQDRDDIVSETLAKVYAAQGNKAKAIATYEKLGLLHPEKSSYFAALIEKLKSDIKG